MARPLHTGFVSPADDHLEGALQLRDFVEVDPDATFYLRARGEGLAEFGVHDGDVIVVDRSARVSHDALAVVVYEDELRLTRVRVRGSVIDVAVRWGHRRLDDLGEVTLWGIVMYVIHATAPGSARVS